MPGFTTIVAPVRDLTAAKAIYTALLGVEPHTDEDFYVGYNVDGCEFGLNPAGSDQGEPGPLALVDVDDIEATTETLEDRRPRRRRRQPVRPPLDGLRWPMR